MVMQRVAIMAANGDLATAYKVLNLANTAAAMGTEVMVFFTFAGIQLLHREANGQLPAPPGLAGMAEALAARGIPTVPELLAMAREQGVRLMACQMTLDLLGMPAEALVDGSEFAGAATFLEFAARADLTLTF